MTDKPDAQWVSRWQTVSKAQAQYLWVLLVVMIFYAALEERTALKVPIVDLQINGGVVRSFGPALISFLVLAVLGTMRGLRTAREHLGLRSSADWSSEELDTSPNAIDLAFYTTRRSPKVIATLVHFVYAFFLALALFEAAWLAKSLVVENCERSRLFIVALGVVLWIPAACLVVGVIVRRIRGVPTLWTTT